jgi:hypothetical protein
MSLNIVSILRSSKIPHDLTLNQIFEYYDKLSSDLFREPSFTELENYICNSQSNQNNNSNTDTSSEVSWVYSGGLLDDDPIDSNVVDPVFHDVTYFNDRYLHNGNHFCSYINCQSCNFLCGNSFRNQQGSIKKCGYQCNYYGELPHNCRGEGFRFFTSDSRSHNAPVPNKRRRSTRSGFYHANSSRSSRRSFSNNRSSHDYVDHDASSGDDYSWCDELNKATDYHYYDR